MKTTHLNADQIDAVLMGSASGRVTTHLASCEACRARVTEAEAGLADFRAVAVAWSERKSATMPTSLSAALAHRASVRQPLAWSAAAMVLFAVGLVTTMAMPGTRVPEDARTQSSAAHSMTAEELAGDNQMLNEIDRELGTSPDAMSTPGMNDAAGEGRGAAVQVED
jgi:predicted anti-sigma-YlaC factor YlaD